ncbi:diguanylate cyclase (GGDEF) domain-containing protein [Arboricoccus pini]|uniref:diguanylate cyclase n=1 Tax=Arboricoccus pini TaxID=1963835 RepID=A0A212RXC3_9PROT|nr:GGDEF domain-containing protein [Arboricoccus pini]SNB77439.1 diguanylate cyclase (GGDEF) domain-containing protein [Arboricoccus pini]
MSNLDSFTLLVAVVVLYLVVGAVLLALWWRERLAALGWWAAAFALTAIGFVVVAQGYGWNSYLERVAGVLIFILAFACALAAAQVVSGHRPARWALVAGPLIWLLLTMFSGQTSFATHIAISSALFGAYSLATGVVLWRSAGGTRLPLRLAAACLWLAHGSVFLLRLVFGLGIGWTSSLVVLWGNFLILEAIIFVSALAVLVAGMTIEQRHLDHRRLAYTDPLTGLGNRRAFEQMLDRLMPLPPVAPPWPVLLLIDLDGFKQINDAFGHPEGDRLLVAFARAIQHWLDEPGAFWRLGGDEFAILLQGRSLTEARATAERVCQTIKEVSCRLVAPGQGLTLTVGLALGAPGMRRVDLVAEADVQLYRGKNEGRDRVIGPAAPDASAA